MMNRMMTAVMAGLLALGAGACIGLVDNAEVAVNLTGLKGEFELPTGPQSFNNVCTSVDAAEYLDVDFATLRNARIYDVRVRTIGQFAGSINSMTLTANGAAFVTGSGAWADYAEPRSVLTSAALQVHQAGVNAVLDAVEARASIALCGSGAMSQALTAGLSIELEVFGQVDAEL